MYSPDQRNVFPGTICRPSRSISRRDMKFDVLLREIIADHADEIDRPEEARADRRIAGRAAEQIGMLLHGSFDGIECDGTNDEDRHGGDLAGGTPEPQGETEGTFFVLRSSFFVPRSLPPSAFWRRSLGRRTELEKRRTKNQEPRTPYAFTPDCGSAVTVLHAICCSSGLSSGLSWSSPGSLSFNPTGETR